MNIDLGEIAADADIELTVDLGGDEVTVELSQAGKQTFDLGEGKVRIRVRSVVGSSP